MKAPPHVYVSDRVSRRDFLKLSSLVAGMGGVMGLSELVYDEVEYRGDRSAPLSMCTSSFSRVHWS